MLRTVAFTAVLALLSVSVSAKKPKWHELSAAYSFEQYAKDFRKGYDAAAEPVVFASRRAAFQSNLKRILAINADSSLTWKAGVNMFTDMTPAEFKATNRFRKAKGDARADAKNHFGAPAAGELLPVEVDWRKATAPRVLTAVKHQGACGSCWAHSSAESIEAQYAMLTGMLPVLSVAQINSCTPRDYNSAGCDGGDYVGSWRYLANQSVVRPDVLKSVTENWAYPIPPRDWFFDDQVNYTTSACVDTSKWWKKPATGWFAELTAAGVSGYNTVDSNHADGGAAAQKALKDVGPQSVSVAAGNWQWYEEGIFKNTAAHGMDNEWQVDHAVQMVGYGYDKELGAAYWLVRNSWSTLWGDDGFIKLWRADTSKGQVEPCSPKEYGPVCGTSGVLCDLASPIVFEADPTKFG